MYAIYHKTIRRNLNVQRVFHSDIFEKFTNMADYRESVIRPALTSFKVNAWKHFGLVSVDGQRALDKSHVKLRCTNIQCFGDRTKMWNMFSSWPGTILFDSS